MYFDRGKISLFTKLEQKNWIRDWGKNITYKKLGEFYLSSTYFSGKGCAVKISLHVCRTYEHISPYYLLKIRWLLSK